MSNGKMQQEFMQAFDDYGDAIFRFCMVKVSNIELAEDMTQETFTRYWQTLRRGSQMTNTRSFLYTVANNLAKDWYKKKKSDSLDEKHEESGFEPADDAVLDSELQAEYHRVLSVIEYMEEGDRDVLMLRFVDGLPPKDIAEIIGESANTVSVRLNRAMKRLRELLNDEN